MIKLIEGEKILYEVRKHWYVLLVESFFTVILSLVPWVVFFGLDVLSVPLVGGEGSLLFFLGTLWLFVTWIVFMIIWTNYYLDVWLVTTRRIIDIEQHGLFSRDFSEFRLDKIQDITIEVKGILPTLLRFGDIHVQTAGEDREFIIKGIPKPYRLRDVMFKEQHRVMKENQDKSVK